MGFMVLCIITFMMLLSLGAVSVQVTFQIPYWVAWLITIGIVGIWFLVKIVLEKEPIPAHHEEDEYDPNATDSRWHWT